MSVVLYLGMPDEVGDLVRTQLSYHELVLNESQLSDECDIHIDDCWKQAKVLSDG